MSQDTIHVGFSTANKIGIIMYCIIKFPCRRVSRTSYRTETYIVYNTEYYCCPGYSGSGRSCSREFLITLAIDSPTRKLAAYIHCFTRKEPNTILYHVIHCVTIQLSAHQSVNMEHVLGQTIAHAQRDTEVIAVKKVESC